MNGLLEIVGRTILPTPLIWFVRIGVPLPAILISAGLFFSMLPPAATEPSGAVGLIYACAVILAISVITPRLTRRQEVGIQERRLEAARKAVVVLTPSGAATVRQEAPSRRRRGTAYLKSRRTYVD